MDGFVCRLCPRDCGALRTPDIATGRCASPSTARVAHYRAHMWEEPPISGTRGSGTIFFTGCGLGCVYCQNHEISAPNGIAGEPCTPQRLADIMRELEHSGVHNISIVTGTHFAPDIIAALRMYRPAVPIVWNSGGYERIETLDALAPFVDIWLPDYKYALVEPAEKYSGARDYPAVALEAIRHMRRLQPDNVIGEDGIMQRGLIVRHLVLPLNTRNSLVALDTLAAELPGTPVSLMSQYTPAVPDTGYAELSRRITAREYAKVLDYAGQLGIDGYAQERDSARREYIPDFGSSLT